MLFPQKIDVVASARHANPHNETVVVQNDTAVEFYVAVVGDNGQTELPEGATYTLVCLHLRKEPTEKLGTLQEDGNVMFKLTHMELSETGPVQAQVRVYHPEGGRLTSNPFTFHVAPDPTYGAEIKPEDQSIIEQVIGEGPAIIAEAKEETEKNITERARLTGEVGDALDSLEQDKADALLEMSQSKTAADESAQTALQAADNADQERDRLTQEVSDKITEVESARTATVEATGEALDAADLATQEADAARLQKDEVADILGAGPVASVNGKTGVVDGLATQESVNQVTAQLAEKASKEEARLKADKLELEDASPTLLAAIEGGEGTTFDLLSIPQNGSVTNEKLGAELKDTLTFSMRNILPNGDFSDGLTGWNVVSNTTALAVSDGVLVATANGTNANANFRQDFPNQAGKFYVKLRFRVKNTAATALSIFAGSKEIRFNRGSYLVNQWQEVSLVMEDTAMNRVSFIHRFPSVADATNQTLEVDSVMVINLTEANYAEATAEEVAVLIADFPDSYFSGYQNLYSAKNILKKIAAKSKTHGTSWLTDYGAKGDGVTDDSAAIQRALTAGGVIWVNPGTYRMSKTHVINSNTTLIGFGESTKFILGDSFELTPTLWRTGDDTLPKYHPYFITASNAENIEVQNLVIEGNKNQFVDQIQVGLAIETAKKIRVKNVRISNVNYFPSQAPPRPAGQFRTGWNFASFRSSDIEVDGGVFEYGGYECMRIGDDCDNVIIKNALLRYGWRTVFQILRGSKNIKMSNCRVIQDDFGTNDSHAAITLHASFADSPIKNFLIEKSVIEAKTFIENPNGGNGISCVGDHFENVSIVDTVITSNGNGLSPRVIGNFKMDNCIVNAQQIGVNLTAVNADKVEIKNTKFNTPGDFALNIIGTKAISMNIEKNELIASNGVGLRSAYANGDSLSIIKNKIASNGLGIQFGAGTIGILYTDDNEITAATNHCIYISSLVVNKRLSVSDNTFAPALANDGIYTAASVNIANAYINRNVSLSGKHGVRLTGTLGDIFVMQNIARNTTRGIDVPAAVISEGNITA